MVVLLQTNEIIFKNSGNLENIIHISQNLAKILTENCFFLIVTLCFFQIALEETFKSLEKKPGKLHYQTLIALVVTQ